MQVSTQSSQCICICDPMRIEYFSRIIIILFSVGILLVFVGLRAYLTEECLIDVIAMIMGVSLILFSFSMIKFVLLYNIIKTKKR